MDEPRANVGRNQSKGDDFLCDLCGTLRLGVKAFAALAGETC